MLVPDVATSQPDQATERRGPALNAAHDAAGQPTKALLGFAQSCGVDVAALEKLETDKGAWFVYRAQKKGQPTAALIPEILAEALKALPIPKPMRWGDHDYSFVRPAHWLVMLHGTDVIDGEILGLKSGRHSIAAIAHVSIIRSRCISPTPKRGSTHCAVRRCLPIQRRAPGASRSAKSSKAQDAQRRGTESLSATCGALERGHESHRMAGGARVRVRPRKRSCNVPQEALDCMTMETNQKFFPVFDGASTSSPNDFIGVANIDSREPASRSAKATSA